MNAPTETSPPATPSPGPAPAHRRRFVVAVIVLLAAFSLPLYELVRFALQSDLYSHVWMIPFISVYLVWWKRRDLPPASPPAPWWWALPPLAAGAALLGYYLLGAPVGEDALACSTLALVFLFIGLCLLLLGRDTVRAVAFPLGFLVLMAPFPTAFTLWIEHTLQQHSALTAHLFFQMSGATFYRHETYIELPGIRLLIAPECSGIHSTLGLFITSLLAGYFFINSPTKRLVLALVVYPIAIFRNGLRIFVIGDLCVRYGPHMIDSYIHRHGGPIFFAISLIPFFLVLWLLARTRRPKPAPAI